jgi:SAM-dependent methyltransferase
MTENMQACPLCENAQGIPFLAGTIDRTKLTALSYASRKEPEFMNFPYVTCPSCDLVYTPTPPAHETLDQAYSGAGYDSSEEAHFAARTYRKIFRPWIKTLRHRNCAVDIGAGNGALLPIFLEEGFKQAVGVEPSPAAIASAPEKVRSMLREGLFTEELIADITPDFVATAMTLEHVRDPLSFLKTIHKKLAEGGMVGVVVHNRRAFLNRLLGKKSPIIDVEHIQLYSPKSLDALFHAAGFTTLFVGSFSNTYPLRYWVRLMPLPSSWKRMVIRILEQLHLAQMPWTMSVGNMVGIARK